MRTDLDCMVMWMAMQCWPQGWHVSRHNAPETYDELCQQYELFGKISVREGNSDRTIFSEPRFNQAFRAWHDWTHLHYRYDFSAEGERKTCIAQMNLVCCVYRCTDKALEWCDLIYADVVGQAEYEARHGVFPEDQKGFVQAYLVDRNAALSAEWK